MSKFSINTRQDRKSGWRNDAKIVSSLERKMTADLTTKDLEALQKRGIVIETAKDQLKRLSQGYQPIRLIRPATPGDGILQFDESKVNDLLEEFNSESPQLDLLKFVPASGAATRMFKALYEDTPENEPLRRQVIENLHLFPFYDVLMEVLRSNGQPIEKLKKENPQVIFNAILQPEGLNYGAFPKGLVPFHRYPEAIRTAFEEHLYEGAAHAVGKGNQVRLHFTAQEEWLDEVRVLLESKTAQLAKFKVSAFSIDFSVQSPSTDTLGLDSNGKPLRDDNGALLFRPGGHGALLHNLNQQRADIIFIKNIDNVIIDAHKYQGLLYKKVLGGLAIQLRRKVHRYCKALEQYRMPPPLRREIEHFLKQCFNIDLPAEFKNGENKKAFVQWAHGHLDRPLRVCGMVKNEGEPGGGPFWVIDSEGRESLQIVEKAQVDLTDEKQAEMLAGSTHFNPVDLVCITRNYKGEPYDLYHFVDHETGFVSTKSYRGESIKALELPGLWNGAMALWNTVFVEVPISTFSPVKTVNDLLRKLHQ